MKPILSVLSARKKGESCCGFVPFCLTDNDADNAVDEGNGVGGFMAPALVDPGTELEAELVDELAPWKSPKSKSGLSAGCKGVRGAYAGLVKRNASVSVSVCA